MSENSSKIELLYMINDLIEKGDVDNAVKLQKIFLDSISEDRENKKYSLEINLDRQNKKMYTTAKDALSNKNNENE
ncbi:hypothetical protein [Acinetobacter sp.]|uniref:hypothetical protein n=1 Tax=Acinetobacter sp. TaxID=472 RepID=UPI003CFCB694